MIKNYNKIKERNRKANSKDALYSKLFSHPISFLLVSLVENTFISPNILTLFSLVFTILGAYSTIFIQSYSGLLFALLFFHFSLVFDSSDGQLARWKGVSSTFGAYFDGIVDHIKHRAIVISIVIRVYDTDNYALLIGIVVIAIHSLAYYENQSRIISELRTISFKKNKKEATATVFGTSKLKNTLANLQIDLHEYYFILAISFISNKPLCLLYFIGINSLFLLIKRFVIFYITAQKIDNENSSPK